MIYAMGAEGFPYFKFGRSNNPSSRIESLQTGCPAKLEVIAESPWPDSSERVIHRALSGSKAHGEWFHENGETMAFIFLMSLPDQETGLIHAMAYLEWLVEYRKRKK